MYFYYCVRTSASVIRNSEVVRYSGAAIVLYIMETSVGAYTSVRYSVDVRYWECPLIETPLYSVSIHVQTNNKNDEDHSLKTEPPSRLKQKVNHLLLVCMYVAPLVVMSAWLMA